MSAESEKNSEESHKERIDRGLGELLNGLRVLLPGVQVLLAVPGQGEGTHADQVQPVARVGSVSVMVSITAGTLLIVDFAFSSSLAWVTAGVLFALVSWAWVVPPFMLRRSRRS